MGKQYIISGIPLKALEIMAATIWILMGVLVITILKIDVIIITDIIEEIELGI